MSEALSGHTNFIKCNYSLLKQLTIVNKRESSREEISSSDVFISIKGKGYRTIKRYPPAGWNRPTVSSPEW